MIFIQSLMRCVPGIGLHFSCLDRLQSHFCSDRQPSAAEALAFGMTSRSMAGIMLIPVTVVKTRYESGVFVYRNITHALRHTYLHEGVRGLTSGLVPTLMRDVPFSGLYFMFYTQLKSHIFPLFLQNYNKTIVNHQTTTNSSAQIISLPLLTFVCGVNAGLMASLVTQPMDVVSVFFI